MRHVQHQIASNQDLSQRLSHSQCTQRIEIAGHDTLATSRDCTAACCLPPAQVAESPSLHSLSTMSMLAAGGEVFRQGRDLSPNQQLTVNLRERHFYPRRFQSASLHILVCSRVLADLAQRERPRCLSNTVNWSERMYVIQSNAAAVTCPSP